MTFGAIGLVILATATAAFVYFAYYWWEVRPANRDKK